MTELELIADILGTDDLLAMLNKYKLKLTKPLKEILKNRKQKKPWSDFVNEKNKKFISDEALDLIDRLMVYDPEDRLTVQEAMKHPYFDPVRAEIPHDEL